MRILVIGTWCVMMFLGTVAMAQEKPGWKLAWSDEFDYTGHPDPAKWDYEEGFIRNNEAQFYTKKRLENARVEDGNLVIEGRKEHFKTPNYDAVTPKYPLDRPSAEYTAAAVVTKEKASWTYGRIEVRAKIPQGKGVWPAIWMLGINIDTVNWPKCGEIDIMEFVGHTPNEIHSTNHFRIDGKHVGKGEKIEVDPPAYDDFHVYAVEWSKDKMDYFYDDRKIFTFNIPDATDKDGTNPFDKPHYLLLNLALGGTWGKTIDDSIFPQKFLIDYVRVYRKAE